MKKKERERKELEKDLLFYLRVYKKIAPDSRHKFQEEIDRLVEMLKELD